MLRIGFLGAALVLAGAAIAACGEDAPPIAESTLTNDGGKRDGQVADTGATVVPDTGAPDTAKPWVCTPLRALTLGETINGTPSGQSHFSGACAGSTIANGPEDVYSLKITTRTAVRITASTTSTSTTPIIRLLRACDVGITSAACADQWPVSKPGSTLFQEVIEPGDYFVVVDQVLAGQPSNYTIRADSFPILPNVTCGGAVELTTAAPITADLRGATSSLTTCSSVTEVGQLYYRISVPPGTTATCTVTPTGPWKATISFLGGTFGDGGTCTPETCISQKTGESAAATALSVDNFAGAGANKEILVAVSGDDLTKIGSFSIALASTALAACPPNTVDGTDIVPGVTHCCNMLVVSNSAASSCGLSCGACGAPTNGSVTCDAAPAQPGGYACAPKCDRQSFRDCDSTPLTCETDISSTASCGSCNGPVCTGAGAGSTATCSVATGCGFTCGAPYEKCPSNPNACTNTTGTPGDPTNCGACGTTCPHYNEPGAAVACNGGNCTFACTPPYALCPGSSNCIDTSSDAQHCGASCNPCAPVEGTSVACVNSACVYSCLPTFCPADSANANPAGGCIRGNLKRHCQGPNPVQGTHNNCGYCEGWLGFTCSNLSTGCCKDGDCFDPFPGAPPQDPGGD